MQVAGAALREKGNCEKKNIARGLGKNWEND